MLFAMTSMEMEKWIKGDLANANAYAEAFPGVVSTRTYTGYELANDLDFSEPTHYLKATTTTNRWTPNHQTTPTNAGWVPIGTNATTASPFYGHV